MTRADMRSILFFGLVLLGLSYSNYASALQVIEGRVVQIEATYMPTRIPFFLSGGNATCPAGTPLYWTNNSQENTKAIYATLMSAFVSGGELVREVQPS
jgi:hypothetical protein